MRKIENILNCLINNLNIGIHIVDDDGKTVYYNDVMASIEGLKKEEVLGKKVDEYLKDVNEDSSTIMKCIKSGKKVKDIIQRYSSNRGKKITTINTTIPVTEDNKLIGAIEIAQDMTQFKEVNEKLCKLQSVLKNNQDHYVFSDIVGKSIAMDNAINKAMKASLSNSSVLIYGETGCGKEVFAQSIHYNGIRSNAPFIPINCAAIPSTLLEGMLFGTTKGSFTGAENKKGLFQLAHRGTILLDEVNSMDTYLQTKLLRVLQDGYIRPIGSSKSIEVDVRIIATLNKEPKDLIKEGKLREDFYYRLSVIRIDIPPLRERREDIRVLTDYFIHYYSKLLGKEVKSVDKTVMEKFTNYNWPGNVRELKNVIESAMNMSDGEIELHKEFFESKIIKQENDHILSSYSSSNLSLNEYMMEIEKKIIKRELENQKRNITKTADILGISRQNLQYKIKKYDIE
ncbi:sigma-54-dependent Fis family transcriptional regulator [Clostridium sp. KNHs214]|uniref:sigma-54 interaction domain-containing protein n=1 Tax=Clostridium sp. KNHs214 TaxID=1540257 RepID=UPI00054D4E0B|nr:sigma-54-dependent Fis family transcriptional regulator [Clostridium sp. KNHs214]